MRAAVAAGEALDTAKHAGQQLAIPPQEDLRFGDLLIRAVWVNDPNWYFGGFGPGWWRTKTEDKGF